MTEQPEATVLTRAMLDAAFAKLEHPSRVLSPYEEATAAWARMQPPDEFQRLVDEALLAGEHVHTYRNGELLCVMGTCDS